jgi:site-specific recombinase XerC
MINRENYLLARDYINFLKNNSTISEKSRDRYTFYLKHLLKWADETPFPQAATKELGFIVYIQTIPGKNGVGYIEVETKKKVIELAKRFFEWAKKYREVQFQSLPAWWIDSMDPPRVTRSNKIHEYVTLEEAIALASIQVDPRNLAMRRDKAATALLYLSGMRKTAMATLPIKNLLLDKLTVLQYVEDGVQTKNSISAKTFMYQIPQLLLAVKDWDNYVRQNLPNDFPWYSSIESHWGEQTLKMEKPDIKNPGSQIDDRFSLLYKLANEQKANLVHKSPHKFRHGHAMFGLARARNEAEYKAVSQNLMHSNIAITDGFYGKLLDDDVQKLLMNLSAQPAHHSDDELSGFIDRLTTDELADVFNIIADRMRRSRGH